jgi:hypothetical protein
MLGVFCFNAHGVPLFIGMLSVAQVCFLKTDKKRTSVSSKNKLIMNKRLTVLVYSGLTQVKLHACVVRSDGA